MDFTEAYRGTCSSVGLAARAGDAASLKTLLEGGGSVDTRDNRGWISFHEAAFHGKAECLQMLLTSKPCLEDRSVLDHCTFEGETALLLAARQGHVDCMRLLLHHGADAKKSTHEGFSPLWEAVSSRKVECVRLLLGCSGPTKLDDQRTAPNGDVHSDTMDTDTLADDHVVKVSTQTNGVNMDLSDNVEARSAEKNDSITSMDHTSESCLDKTTCRSSMNSDRCDDKCVQSIKDAGSDKTWQVDVNCRTYTGQRPLHQAAETGQCEVVQLLIDHGARLDTYDDNHISPVFLAAHSGQNECIRLMLDEAKKQNKAWLVNRRACDAATPLYLAAQKGHTDTVRLLLEYGADANLMSQHPRLLPLHAAIQLRQFGCMELLFPVTSQEAVAQCDIGLLDVSLPNLNLRSLQIMIRHGVDVVEELNFIPTDMVQENSYSIFPFVTEEPFCYKTLMLIGLAVGGDVDIFPDPGQRCPVVRCLLEAGVSPEPQIEGEMPPVVAAVYTNNPEVLDLLLDHGANPRIHQTDFSGNVAVIMAAGLVPPSPCLLQLFLAGQTPDSCFGRRPRCARRFVGKTWTLQKLLMCYPDRNPWLSYQRLRCLISLSWSPQLHPGLEDIVQNTAKWEQLQQLAVECSSLAHLCRRQIYRSVATKTLYVPESLVHVELPKTLINYLFASPVGQCYQELSSALYTDRQQRLKTR